MLLAFGCPPELLSEKARLFPDDLPDEGQETEEQGDPADQKPSPVVSPPPHRNKKRKKKLSGTLIVISTFVGLLAALPGAWDTLRSILRHLLSLFR